MRALVIVAGVLVVVVVLAAALVVWILGAQHEPPQEPDA